MLWLSTLVFKEISKFFKDDNSFSKFSLSDSEFSNFILTSSNCFNISSYLSSNSVLFFAELTSLFKVSIVASLKSISSFKEETIFSSVDISLFKAKILL